VILADPADRARVGGLRHLSAPLPEVDALPVHPEAVLIVENKESAYLFPGWPRTVVVHSLGNHLNVLDEIGWLEGAHQLYWGDLDRAGFTLLSRAVPDCQALSPSSWTRKRSKRIEPSPSRTRHEPTLRIRTSPT